MGIFEKLYVSIDILSYIKRKITRSVFTSHKVFKDSVFF